MTIVGATLGLVLGFFQLILLARIVMDWATLFAGQPAHGSFRAQITLALYKITEPVLAPVRRLIPPLRMGGVGIDLSIILVFIALVVLRSIVTRL